MAADAPRMATKLNAGACREDRLPQALRRQGEGEREGRRLASGVSEHTTTTVRSRFQSITCSELSDDWEVKAPSVVKVRHTFIEGWLEQEDIDSEDVSPKKLSRAQSQPVPSLHSDGAESEEESPEDRDTRFLVQYCEPVLPDVTMSSGAARARLRRRTLSEFSDLSRSRTASDRTVVPAAIPGVPDEAPAPSAGDGQRRLTPSTVGERRGLEVMRLRSDASEVLRLRSDASFRSNASEDAARVPSLRVQEAPPNSPSNWLSCESSDDSDDEHVKELKKCLQMQSPLGRSRASSYSLRSPQVRSRASSHSLQVPSPQNSPARTTAAAGAQSVMQALAQVSMSMPASEAARPYADGHQLMHPATSPPAAATDAMRRPPPSGNRLTVPGSAACLSLGPSRPRLGSHREMLTANLGFEDDLARPHAAGPIEGSSADRFLSPLPAQPQTAPTFHQGPQQLQPQAQPFLGERGPQQVQPQAQPFLGLQPFHPQPPHQLQLPLAAQPYHLLQAAPGPAPPGSPRLLAPASPRFHTAPQPSPHESALAPHLVPVESREPSVSLGSGQHHLGTCKPCAWYWRAKGCINSAECRHCHLCPASEVKARRRARLIALRWQGD